MQLVRNCTIYTPTGSIPLKGEQQGRLLRYAPGAMVIENGHISAIGMEDDLLSQLTGKPAISEIDCEGRLVIPGFVDPHTHMCFAALRENEFSERLAGKSYLEILAQGGGILSSVNAVKKKTSQEIAESSRKHLDRALVLGTTTIEIKSGYGLDTENELKLLAAIGQMADECVLDIFPTFLGAHALPQNYRHRADDFITMVIDEMLPAVMHQNIAKHCDIFCEKNVFSIQQSKRLLDAARDAGLKIKLHADEVYDLRGATLAAEIGALSADHLLAASNEGIRAMARAGVIATLLPATAYSLKKPYARARDIISQDVAVALATDCNPGSSYTESMQFVIGLAVQGMDMTPEEALTAATLNAAHALGLGNKVGSLEPGKQADFLEIDGETPAIFAYHAGVSSVTKSL